MSTEQIAFQVTYASVDSGDGVDSTADAELDEEYGEAFEQLDDPTDDLEELSGFGMPDDDNDLENDLFAPEPVRVTEFSRRGPWVARLTAQLLDADVDYLEDGTWSVYRYRTDRAHGATSGGRADGPIIEVNIPQHGEAWIEVTPSHGQPAMFWPNAEQLTRSVLDIGAIAVPESAELYRRMLAEADGVRDEIAELGLGIDVDEDAAHRACLPEALGGIVGADARLLERHPCVAAIRLGRSGACRYRTSRCQRCHLRSGRRPLPNGGLCFLDEIGEVANLGSGRQGGTWDGCTATSSYHPDDGANVIIVQD